MSSRRDTWLPVPAMRPPSPANSTGERNGCVVTSEAEFRELHLTTPNLCLMRIRVRTAGRGRGRRLAAGAEAQRHAYRPACARGWW